MGLALSSMSAWGEAVVNEWAMWLVPQTPFKCVRGRAGLCQRPLVKFIHKQYKIDRYINIQLAVVIAACEEACRGEASVAQCESTKTPNNNT